MKPNPPKLGVVAGICNLSTGGGTWRQANLWDSVDIRSSRPQASARGGGRIPIGLHMHAYILAHPFSQIHDHPTPRKYGRPLQLK